MATSPDDPKRPRDLLPSDKQWVDSVVEQGKQIQKNMGVIVAGQETIVQHQVLIDEQQVKLEILKNRNRRNIRLIGLGLLFDVVLTLVGLRLYIDLDSSRKAQHAACLAREQIKSTDKQLWTYILTVSQSGQQKSDPQVIAKFQTILHQYDPVPC